MPCYAIGYAGHFFVLFLFEMLAFYRESYVVRALRSSRRSEEVEVVGIEPTSKEVLFTTST